MSMVKNKLSSKQTLTQLIDVIRDLQASLRTKNPKFIYPRLKSFDKFCKKHRLPGLMSIVKPYPQHSDVLRYRDPQTGRYVDKERLARTRRSHSKMFEVQKILKRLLSSLFQSNQT